MSTVFREYFGRSTYGKDFLQGGIEILGDPSPECDGEVIVMAAEILKAVGVENIRIDIGTAAYTQALFDALPFAGSGEGPAAGLSGRPQSRRPAPLSERLVPAGKRPLRPGSAAGPVRTVRPDPGQGEGLLPEQRHAQRPGAAGKNLRLYFLYAGFADKVQLDFGFASRLGYYTDMVFKVYVDGALYDVIDGGRYDTLSAQFGIDRPACGFGMNINLLYEFMNDAGLLAQAEPSFQLAVSYAASDQVMVRDLMRWRSQGFRVAAYPESSFIDSRDYSIHAVYRGGSY